MGLHPITMPGQVDPGHALAVLEIPTASGEGEGKGESEVEGKGDGEVRARWG